MGAQEVKLIKRSSSKTPYSTWEYKGKQFITKKDPVTGRYIAEGAFITVSAESLSLAKSAFVSKFDEDVAEYKQETKMGLTEALFEQLLEIENAQMEIRRLIEHTMRYGDEIYIETKSKGPIKVFYRGFELYQGGLRIRVKDPDFREHGRYSSEYHIPFSDFYEGQENATLYGMTDE